MIMVLTANASRCRLYFLNQNKTELVFHKEIAHPENRLKNGDLTADKSGNFQSSSYEPHMDAKEIKIADFSREIAKELNQQRNDHQFDDLIVVAPPHLTGLLLQHFNKHVKDLISKSIQKDVLHLSDAELMDYLKESIKYTT